MVLSLLIKNKIYSNTWMAQPFPKRNPAMREMQCSLAEGQCILSGNGHRKVQDRTMTDSPIDMLFEAARAGDVAAAQDAIAQGARIRIDAEDEDGRTPLMCALATWHFCPVAGGDYVACMKLLVAHNANINHRDHDGNTSLMLAAEWGTAKAIDDLLSLGANPNVVNDNKHTALMFATTSGHIHIARTLLEKGANPLLLNTSGSAAIHIAADWDNVDFIALFLENKVDINLRDAKGMTPLMRAALCGQETGARYILSAGGDPSLTDRDGKTALQHASTLALWKMIEAARENAPSAKCTDIRRDVQESLRPYRKLRKPVPTI